MRDTLQIIRTMDGYRIENHGIKIADLIPNVFDWSAYDASDIEIPLPGDLSSGSTPKEAIAEYIWLYTFYGAGRPA